MSDKVIFKTLPSVHHKHVFDRHTHSIFRVANEEYAELQQVEKGELSADQSPVIKKYQEFGLFKPNIVEGIEHPSTTIIEQYMNTRLRQLTLQLTTALNSKVQSAGLNTVYNSIGMANYA